MAPPLALPNLIQPEMIGQFIEARWKAERDYVNSRFSALEDAVNVLRTDINERMRDSEANRNSALDKASLAIQAGLDKAERSLQVALDRAQSDLRNALVDAEKRVNDKFDVKDAISAKADTVLNDRLEQMNLFRDQISAERLLYVTRDQLEVSLKGVMDQLDIVKRTMTLASGQSAGMGKVAGAVVVIFSILAAIGTMITAAGLFFKGIH